MKRKLYIDLETFSSVDLKTAGAYKYTESPDFEILLLGFAFDNDPVQVVDLAHGEPFPPHFLQALEDPEVEKVAHNATFERLCFRAYGFIVPVEQWFCTAVKAAYCGLAVALDMVSEALNLGEKGKLSTGRALIRYFCNPCKPTKVNGGRKRNIPVQPKDQEKWEDFKSYLINDVVAEREIDHLLEPYEFPEFERKTYIIDQEVNDRGILIDIPMAENAVVFDELFTEEVMEESRRLTGLDNPNSVSQLGKWIEDETLREVPSVTKDDVERMIKEDHGELVTQVLNNRLKLGKTSVKKYTAMLNCVCGDGRAHGLFQYMGANRTGRWAGRLIQLQNLPQNHMQGLEEARRVVASGDYELAEMLYDSIPDVLSELIRTTFVAPPGHTFIVSDFSAIEARVLSWLAQEQWRLDVFNTHGKIYEASAAMMFNVPISSVTKGSDLRQKGKTAELALGYQGAIQAMRKMARGGFDHLNDQEVMKMVTLWRKANPAIVKFWAVTEEAAKRAITTRRTIRTKFLTFSCSKDYLRITLPVGRDLYYRNPRIGANRFGNESILFDGVDGTIKKWDKIETYGGKLVENIVQAVSRDLLAYAMQQLYSRGYKIVMHVHDEIVCEVPEVEADFRLNEMNTLLSTEVPWAPGLPLAADGYSTPFYKKD